MIDLSLFEGHTPAPWIWNDDWCSALIGLPDKEDADIYDEDAQTVISVDTKHTPICNSFYEYDPAIVPPDARGEERWGGVTIKLFPEEELRNNALRSEDAMLIAYAPKLLAEVKRLREENDLLRSVQMDGIEASAYNESLAKVKRLQRTAEEHQRCITFLVNMLTPEQDCRWTHFVGGFCTWEECPHTEDE